MTNQTDDRARVRRQREKQAIDLAMAAKWEEAVQANRTILALQPRTSESVEAYNRLGKALTELGRYAEAREAYGQSLKLDPANSIAKKNMERLRTLGDAEAGAPTGRQKADPDLFIEETGKTGSTVLQRVDPKALARMAASDLVLLKVQDSQLQVTDPEGTYLGAVDTRLAVRLINLMKTGNQYAAAITSVSPTGESGRVIIKETFQSADNVGKLSFPPSGGDGFRAYTRDALVKYDDEDDDHDEQTGDEWDTTDDTEDGNELGMEMRRSPADRADDEEFEE
jgi:tetratricopeptide (TPR) repeat protein